jgi:hypothetical protein
MIREYEFRRLPGKRGGEGPCVMVCGLLRRHPSSCAHCPVLTLLSSEPIFVDVRTGRKVLAPRVSSADRACRNVSDRGREHQSP